jgi:hypothetical protein
MRHMGKLFVLALLSLAPLLQAAEPPAGGGASPQVESPSQIVAVTVYSSSALVTRQVTTPAVAGVVELVVGNLPPSVSPTSLYSEGADGVRILSTRYRTRVVQESTADESRKLEAQLKELRRGEQDLQRQIQANEQNLGLLAKLEGFTSDSLKQLTEKGMLSSDQVTNLAKFVMETRTTRSAAATQLAQKLADLQEQQQFVQRQMTQLVGSSDKTVREAVIVIDTDRAAAGTVKLNYIVSRASWRPNYKLRAARDKADVSLEYLAAIQQQSGEDWKNVDLVLSTAQPRLNAAPPDLAMLDIGISAGRGAGAGGAVSVNGNQLGLGASNRGNNFEQARQLREEGQLLSNSSRIVDANLKFNDAAAFLQGDEIINPQADKPGTSPQRSGTSAAYLEGQSVTFHLERRLSVPWRDDEQVVEVARLNLKPDYFYKAVPVLTPHVYRLANLTNDTKLVILPGEGTMYVDADFVGRASLPLVAIGETFTTGFGVDPQLQVTRQLVEKTRTVQGGNQVHRFDYRLAVSSYKSEPVKLQLWDRLPHGETESVNVTLATTSKDVSTDTDYVRDDKPKNLLRWDLTITPEARGEKAVAVTYQYRMEYAREASIGTILSK